MSMHSSSDDEEDLPNQGEQEDWDWQEYGEGADSEPTPSLFNPKHLLPSPLAAIEHDAQQHGFNLLTYAHKERLDEYDIIRVINYMRHEVQQGGNPLPGPSNTLFSPSRPSSSNTAASQGAPWQDDRFLMPVLPEDPLLCFDFQEALEQLAQQQPEDLLSGSTLAAAAGSQQRLEKESKALREENRMLRDENEALRELVLQLRLDVMPSELQLEEVERGNRAGLASTTTLLSPLAGPSGTSANPSSQPPHLTHRIGQPLHASHQGPATSSGVLGSAHHQSIANLDSSNQGQRGVCGGSTAGPGVQGAGQSAKEEIDSSYFDSYSGFNIHREMISDKPRTDAYRAAIEGNRSLLSGKRVMDVGCGTGILSLFAARAGAQRVVAIDGSSDIAKVAAQIAEVNGHSVETGGAIDVVSARVEQLAELPGGVGKVDVIVSEWMGYGLLFEAMLDSVLTARDRWLAPGGVVLPDVATIHVAGGNYGSLGLQFWQDVYGFSMKPIAEELQQARSSRANVLPVEPSDIVTNTVMVKSLDMCTMKSEDQDFTTEFVLTARDFEWPGTSDAHGVHEVHAIVLWFDTSFSAARCPEAEVVLSTSPFAPTTHWAQTVLPLKKPLTLRSKEAAANGADLKWTHEIKGRLSMARDRSKHRSLDISLEHTAVLADGSMVQDTSVYAMSVLQ